MARQCNQRIKGGKRCPNKAVFMGKCNKHSSTLKTWELKGRTPINLDSILHWTKRM